MKVSALGNKKGRSSYSDGKGGLHDLEKFLLEGSVIGGKKGKSSFSDGKGGLHDLEKFLS